jgi:hypothetical protein
MLELTIYGLVGLAAMLVIAFYFAYADEFSSTREKSSFDLINNPYSNDAQMMEIGKTPPNAMANSNCRQTNYELPPMCRSRPPISRDQGQRNRGRAHAIEPKRRFRH